MRESYIESYLIKRIRHLGGKTRKLAYVGTNGAPDRLIMLYGRVAFVELKAPGKEPRTNQSYEMQLLRDHGQIVCVIDSIEGVDEFVDSIGNH